jgi:iron complex transport system substrate-binding protein
MVAVILSTSLSFGGCGAGGAEKAGVYYIDISGTLQEPGVITYLGHTMNVYKDQASNPCGDCAQQPVSVLVGDDAAVVAEALAKALTEDFGGTDWVVEEVGAQGLSVRRAAGASVADPAPPVAPGGLSIAGGFGSERETGTTDTATGVGGQIRNIKQFDGTVTQVPLAPARIAAVYGPSYEALVVLGAEDRIVVRADVQTENFPWATEIYRNIDALPVLRDVHAAVNVEQLLTYEPDLVYTFPRPNEIAMLGKAQVAYVAGATTRTLEESKELLRVFASGIGAEAQDRADLYEAWFDERLAMVTARTAGLSDEDRPKVYYAGTDILTTYGQGSDIIEVIEAAGGTAVSKTLAGGNRIATDAEQLAAWNPDWIFIDHCGMSGSGDASADAVAARAYANPKYAGLTAIQKEQVVLTPSGVFYWDMGLQKILLVEYMAKTIHPELFEDLDMAAEVQDFYTTFFGYPLTYEQAEAILAREAPG